MFDRFFGMRLSQPFIIPCLNQRRLEPVIPYHHERRRYFRERLECGIFFRIGRQPSFIEHERPDEPKIPCEDLMKGFAIRVEPVRVRNELCFDAIFIHSAHEKRLILVSVHFFRISHGKLYCSFLLVFLKLHQLFFRHLGFVSSLYIPRHHFRIVMHKREYAGFFLVYFDDTVGKWQEFFDDPVYAMRVLPEARAIEHHLEHAVSQYTPEAFLAVFRKSGKIYRGKRHAYIPFSISTALSICGSFPAFTSSSLIFTSISGVMPSVGICVPSGSSQRATVILRPVVPVIGINS